MTTPLSDTLFSYVSCHQSYAIGVTLIDPVPS